MEVDKLNALKSSKMKELILKKQLELEAIYKGVHIDTNAEEARLALIDVIESGLSFGLMTYSFIFSFQYCIVIYFLE